MSEEIQELKVTIVVPTIRENCIHDFLSQWEDEFTLRDAHVIVVEDNPTCTFDIRSKARVTHLSWEDIDRELGDASWIIPRRTDCVRSYGYFKAWQDQPDMIITLDDDCYPIAGQKIGFIEKHWMRLEEGGRDQAWAPSGEGVVTRGVPYYHTERRRRCVLNHGLWTNVPDFDAATQLVQERNALPFEFKNFTVPFGKYMPMCGMNVAIRPEVVPAFYFLLMGQNYEVDRFGDIWSGVLVKKICDHLGLSMNSGDPAIEHQRASNVFANLRKEAPGMELNETLWDALDKTTLRGTSFGECFRELAESMPVDDVRLSDYVRKCQRAMIQWTELFESAPITAPRTAVHASAIEAVREAN